jgi:hypothetical protein
MTEKERFLARLDGMNTVDFHFTRGSGPATEEEMYAEMNRALDQMEDGTATVSPTFDDEMKPVDVRSIVRLFNQWRGRR